MTKKQREECKSFVAGIFLSTTEGREPMCVADAYVILDNWKADGVEVPAGLTAYQLATMWDECLEEMEPGDVDPVPELKVSETVKTTTYETGVDGFMVDIVEGLDPDTAYDVWLYHKKIGIKDYVFGDAKSNNTSFEELLSMTANYLVNDLNLDGLNWYQEYRKNHMEE